MDRFIVKSFLAGVFIYTHLKSNMDRFIVFGWGIHLFTDRLFKIQYGQIYRQGDYTHCRYGRKI